MIPFIEYELVIDINEGSPLTGSGFGNPTSLIKNIPEQDTKSEVKTHSPTQDNNP